jgi:DNA polymerase III subunit epsilon
MPPAPPPPSGPPWDLVLTEAPFAFVDLEMTGLDAEKDRVVEVCVERVLGGEVIARVATLVNPGERVGGASQIHGLDAAALCGAPTFDAVADAVLRALDGAVLVAHAAEWDVRFLLAELARAHKSVQITHWLDTLNLSRRAFSFPSHALVALCESLGIPRERAHRAADDVAALRAVFEKCVAALAPTTVRDLWEVKVNQRVARAHIVEACVAAAEHGVAVTVTYRPSRRSPEPLIMVITEVVMNVDPPRVVGYLLPGRGRKELRADRILRVDPTTAPV